MQLAQLVEIGGPELVRIRLVSNCRMNIANKTSLAMPSSTTSGTPDVPRNITSAMPLSSMSTPMICNTALRRGNDQHMPIKVTASPIGMARTCGADDNATTSRVVA